MILNHNPFLTKVYTGIWKKYFFSKGRIDEFESLSGIEFIKTQGLPVYINVGKRMTQGMTYEFKNPQSHKKLEKKVFLIYDVPEYLEVPIQNSPDIGLFKSLQYDGYLANLTDYETVHEYIKSNVKPKSRRLIEGSKKRLDMCFDIRYHVLIGPKVTDKEYKFYFDRFRALLLERYDLKDVEHPFLRNKVWEYHRELVLTMIRANNAALFIIQEGGNPIAISLNYLGDNIVFSALPAFDLDFKKFNLGHIMTFWKLDWCKQNEVSIFDFSKGHYDYKRRWSNKKYNVNYHILYDRNSTRARFLAASLFWFFEKKRVLRNSNFLGNLKRGYNSLKIAGNKKTSDVFTLKMEDEIPADLELSIVRLQEIPHLIELVYEFLFRTKEKKEDIKLLKPEDPLAPVYIRGVNHIGSIHKIA